MDRNESRTDAPILSRRAAMGTAAAAGVGALIAGSERTSAQGSPGGGSRVSIPGWNAAKGEYELPPLPYGYDALEPLIDEETMRIHHDKHHRGYVNGLNKALAKLREIREGTGDAGEIKFWSNQLSFNGSGHVNHAMFWAGMAAAGKGGGGYPSGALAERIERDFGTFEQFAGQFKVAAKSVEGSGWGWLVLEPMSGKLMVIQGEKQQDLMLTGAVPLLGVDVWEHAYYLKYQNRRGDYLDAFMNVVNWAEIGRRYGAATA